MGEDILSLSYKQASERKFPPGCEVYILYDEHESPASIDAQGYVEGALFRRMTNNTFVECYRVHVKCRNDEGVFYPKEDVIEVSKLRFKNGTHVNFNVEDSSTASNNNDTIQKEGIILGFCDIPQEKIKKDHIAVKNRRFWYCVQEIHGEKKIYPQVLPEKISYRHREVDKKNDEDHGDVAFVKAEIKEAEVSSSKSINIPVQSATRPNIIRDTSPDSSKDKTNGLLDDRSSSNTQGMSRDSPKPCQPYIGSSRSFDDRKENLKCMRLPMVTKSAISRLERNNGESKSDLIISSQQQHDQSKTFVSRRGRKRNLDDRESTNCDGKHMGKQARERKTNVDSEKFTCCLHIPFRKDTIWDLVIGERGKFHRYLLKESQCQTISVFSVNSNSCRVNIDGGNKANHAETAVKIIKNRLRGLEANGKGVHDISLTRDYKWCEHHNRYGHTTEECRSTQSVREHSTS